jgi:hypothetical protein
MPEDSGISGGPKEPLSKSGILDVLNSKDDKELNLELKDEDDEDDDPEREVETEVEDPDKEVETKEIEPEKDELAELEEELKEPKDEDLELTTPVKKREILAKFPTIFKDFPSLETAYYRELEYTKLLPTIQDAREAVNAVTVLENFEKDLKEGKTVELFKAVLKDDPNAFAKLADTYMDNLAQADERAYHHVLGNITKDIVEAMVRAGKKSENKDLQDSATVLYQFMFGDVEWKPKAKLAIPDEPNSERASLEKDKEDFERTKYSERQSELMTGVDNRITSVIDANIDKTNLMTPFVKKNAIKEVQSKLDSLVKADTRFQSIVTRLWQKAKEAKYNRDSMQAIETAHISKRRSLLPTVIVAIKKEALKGSTISRKKATEDKSKDEPIENTNENPRRQSPQGDSKRIDKTKPLPNESSLDFLMRR